MKRFLLLIFSNLIAFTLLAQRVETTILEVSGNIATPIKVLSSNGTFEVYSKKVIKGIISVRSAYDANGDKIVVPNGDYKSSSSNGVTEYTRIYRFKTLYEKSSCSPYDKENTNERNYNFNNKENNTTSLGAYQGSWIKTSGRNSNILEIKPLDNGSYSIISYNFLDGELQFSETRVAKLNDQGMLEEKINIKRDYDHAIRYTTSIYEINGNSMTIHSTYKTDFYDNNFQNYKYTGEIDSKKYYYTRN